MIKKLNQKGVSLVELMIATTIMATMATSVIMARSFMAKQTVITDDRAYATQKAIQMFEELKSLVNGSENGVEILDNYSDTTYNTILTTDKTVDVSPTNSGNPANALSGNKAVNGHWRYLRFVQVINVANDPQARQVIIKVWRYGSDSAPLSPPMNGTVPALPLAEVGGILRTTAISGSPTQVMDVYLIDIENTQGWWAPVDSSRAAYSSGVSTILASTNNTLQIRYHNITRSSYGRDSQYLPSINLAKGTDQAPSSWVYLYPGLAPQDSSGGEAAFYQPPNGSQTLGVLYDGNFNVDGTPQYTTQLFTGAPSYSAADQYNHSLRYPDEVAAWEAVTQAYINSGNTSNTAVTEISERMLIEGMLSSPQSFENALIVNLHAELLPVPPMRDYSDAAKDPANIIYGNNASVSNGEPVSLNTCNARVVTHSELLYYPVTVGDSAVSQVKLRVYAYYDGMDDITKLDTIGSPGHAATVSGGVTYDPKLPAISVFLPNYYINATNPASGLAITAICGMGVSMSSTNPGYFAAPITWNTAAPYNGYPGPTTLDNTYDANPVSVAVTNIGPGNKSTLITLYNTRLRCPAVSTTSGGLTITQRLYGLEYIPCSPDGAIVTNDNNYTFTSQDLTNSAAATAMFPKNTARWIISLLNVPATVFASTSYNVDPTSEYTDTSKLIVETRIGNAVTTNSAGASFSTIPLSGGATIPGTTIIASDIPTNLSRTYVWIGAGDPPPTTEQYQFLGDPRDCPYLDVKAGGPSITGAGATILANGYNWYFKNLTSSAASPATGYSGYADTNNTGWGCFGQEGWNTDYINIENDFPRYLQMIRQGILNSTAIWTTVSGYMDYYYGLGGEIGYDTPPFSDGVTYMQAPWATSSASVSTVLGTDEILTESWKPPGCTNYERVPANIGNGTVATNAWYAKPWLGELYPDSQYVTFWNNSGNLPTLANTLKNAADPVTFYREDYAFIPTPTTYGVNGGFRGIASGPTTYHYGKATGTEGSSAFFNGTTNGVTTGYPFTQDAGTGATDTGNLYTLGLDCFSIFGYSLSDVLYIARPFSLSNAFTSSTSGGWPQPTNWAVTGANGYSSLNTISVAVNSSSVSELFYNYNPGGSFGSGGSGVIQLTSPTSQVGYVVVNGIAESAYTGTNIIANSSLVFLLRTFLDMGLQSTSGTYPKAHIEQLPLVQVSVDQPTNQYFSPSSISVTLASPVLNSTGTAPVTDFWYRFPGFTSTTGNFYTEQYPGYNNLLNSTYSESATLLVNLKYSPDSGTNWYPLQVPQPLGTTGTVEQGILDTADEIVTTSLPTQYTWDVSNTTDFPQGHYIIQGEAYLQNRPLHYAFDQQTVEIDR